MSDQTQQGGQQAGQHQQHEQQLRQHGVTEQSHLEKARAALNAGFNITDVIGWVTKYGPTVLELVQEIISKVQPQAQHQK